MLIDCETLMAGQLKELNSRGYEVILVTSGAVGLGRQRLRYRRLANSRFLIPSLFCLLFETFCFRFRFLYIPSAEGGWWHSGLVAEWGYPSTVRALRGV